MPQIQVGSTNIDSFGFSAKFDIRNRRVVFDTSTLTTYNGSGASLVQGIAFALVDSEGVELASIDWSNPQIPDPSSEQTYTLDLSALPYTFLFQKFKIVGAIKDEDGTVYETTPVYKSICQPPNFTTSGYVPGLFQVTPDCTNNVLTVQDLTNMAYNNLTPESKDVAGTFYYPTGTISPITFASTPWSNNVIYTGENRVVCNTQATYNFGDDIYVVISYQTDNAFPVTCSNKMSSVLCCIVDLQTQYQNNCNTAVGSNALQKLNSITLPFLTGIAKEMNGQDSSIEAEIIRKTLACNCGSKTIKSNQAIPVNPSVYNILLEGEGGTTIGDPVITGTTKKWIIASNSYQVVKSDLGDLAFTITQDTSTANVVKYKIAINYDVFANTILTAIQNNNTLLTLFNSLVSITNFNIDLSNLNGKCVIDLSSTNYFLSLRVPSSANTITEVSINGNEYNPTSPIAVNNPDAIEAWLNGLGLGMFEVDFSSGVTGSYINILTIGNVNEVKSATFNTGSSQLVYFQNTNKSIVAVLQAIIDYLCGLSTLQVALGNSLSLCYFDYNGNVVYYNYTSGNTQAQFNSGVASAICTLTSRITSLTSVTCAKMKELFAENAQLVFNVATDKLLAIVNGECVAINGKQLGIAVMSAVNAYSDVKDLFCGVSCSAPGACPEISNINMSTVGGDIGIYGVSWNQAPIAAQTLTVRYRKNGTSTWSVATTTLAVFANGNVSGTSPYLITGLDAGETYDVYITNNCGGTGTVKQITIPETPVISASYLLENTIYDICGASPTTLYSSSPFAEGVTMYTDVGLTTPVTGYTYIANNDGDIHLINTSTGVVGVDTGSDCDAGTAGLYILGNSTGIICGGSTVTRYTDGEFAVGKTLYTDSGLTTPVTGSSYVVDVSTGIIYNLNSVTGVIGASTGLNCSGFGTFTIENSITVGGSGNKVNSITPAVYVITSGSLPLSPIGTASGNHAGFTAELEVDVDAPAGTLRLILYKNDVIEEIIDVSSSTTYTFASITAAPTDSIKIEYADPAP